MTKNESSKIYTAGAKMSNWLFNMGQSEEFRKYSHMMREMVEEWDNNKKPLLLMTIDKRRKKS
jgi:hypothetical protein